jgi:threonine/homoserine/homoserine lactone efflux protein
MFWTALGEVLAPGVGAAISPMPIVAVLLLVTGGGGRRKALLFATGFVLAVFAVSMIVLALSDGADVSSSSTPSKIASAVTLLLGVLFLWLAWKQWSNRPRAGHEVASPKWMKALDTATPGAAFKLGLVLSAVSLKNLPLMITASTGVAQTGVSVVGAVIVLVVFSLLAGIGLFFPLVMLRFGPAGTEAKVVVAKDFLISHSAVIVAVLFVILGGQNIGKALGPLFS